MPVTSAGYAPLVQGDALWGLTLAVAGVGPAGGATLPRALWPNDVGGSDAWAVAVGADSGWYVLVSQDCDITRDPSDEPTVQIAPLVMVTDPEWGDLEHNGYSARKMAYPSDNFVLPAGHKLAVDLAWTTSILKGSLYSSGVSVTRPLTGPQRRDFGEWLGARHGRAPFDDDVVACVLDPCHQVRERLLKSARKAGAQGTAKLEARAVLAAARWYAHVDGRLVTVLGVVTGNDLHQAGFVTPDGTIDTESLDKGRVRLEAEMIKRMNLVGSGGFQLKLVLIDLAKMQASSFTRFSLLLR